MEHNLAISALCNCRLSPPSVFSLVRGVFAGRSQPLLPTGSSRRYLCESFLGCLIPYPGGSTKCFYLFLPLWHRPSPKKETGRLPQFLANTTFREAGFRGCRYFFMFRPPSLLVSQIVPTAAVLPQGSRDFYFRAERASLPLHAPDMLTVRIQVIDGTRTFTLLDSQPCRLLILPSCYSSYGAWTLTPVGLAPTVHGSLRWTHTYHYLFECAQCIRVLPRIKMSNLNNRCRAWANGLRNRSSCAFAHSSQCYFGNSISNVPSGQWLKHPKIATSLLALWN